MRFTISSIYICNFKEKIFLQLTGIHSRIAIKNYLRRNTCKITLYIKYMFFFCIISIHIYILRKIRKALLNYTCEFYRFFKKPFGFGGSQDNFSQHILENEASTLSPERWPIQSNFFMRTKIKSKRFWKFYDFQSFRKNSDRVKNIIAQVLKWQIFPLKWRKKYCLEVEILVLYLPPHDFT